MPGTFPQDEFAQSFQLTHPALPHTLAVQVSHFALPSHQLLPSHCPHELLGIFPSGNQVLGSFSGIRLQGQEGQASPGFGEERAGWEWCPSPLAHSAPPAQLVQSCALNGDLEISVSRISKYTQNVFPPLEQK